MTARGYDYIDYVVCNLYPFEKTVSRPDCSLTDAVENIDIGGVTLLRAAAKNLERVVVVCDPSDYEAVAEYAESAATLEAAAAADLRQQLSVKAFVHTARYDFHISTYLRTTLPNASTTMPLRYGTNPHQSHADVTLSLASSATQLPIRVVNHAPGYINMLDALNAFQLVQELKEALSLPAAASFKHVSPAGAAVANTLTAEEAVLCMIPESEREGLSPLATAYARARGADRMSSFGDWIALSDECDESTARIISREVSDGVIAPGYSADALAILQKKKGGKYTLLAMDPTFTPPSTEMREVAGLQLTQTRNSRRVTRDLFANIVSQNKQVRSWWMRSVSLT